MTPCFESANANASIVGPVSAKVDRHTNQREQTIRDVELISKYEFSIDVSLDF